eukprot:GILJ01000855.1.p1 GENE.GILJ01000855.1~~GILJ01000855.1.p1  ORF type:complete len:485 (-),score=60.13 GILJ01000855.1:197-1597(-)
MMEVSKGRTYRRLKPLFLILVSYLCTAIAVDISQESTSRIVVAMDAHMQDTSNPLSATQQSRILGQLLAGYDKTIAPIHLGTNDTTISMKFRVVHMDGIIDRDGTYRVHFVQYISWKDSRLAFTDQAAGSRIYLHKEQVQNIWQPTCLFGNSLSVEAQDMRGKIWSDGSVSVSAHMLSVFYEESDLRSFPWDEQDFPVVAWCRETFDFGYNLSLYGSKPVDFAPGAYSTEWRLLGVEADVYRVQVRTDRADNTDQRVVLKYYMRRHVISYFVKFIFPLTLVTMLSFIAPFMEPDGNRLALSTTMVLTVVALFFTISDELPRIAYHTWMDIFIAVCFLYTCSNIILFLTVYLNKRKQDEEEKRRQHEAERSNIALMAQKDSTHVEEEITTDPHAPLLGSRSSTVLKPAVHPAQTMWVDRIARWVLPLSFLSIMLILILLGYYKVPIAGTSDGPRDTHSRIQESFLSA